MREDDTELGQSQQVATQLMEPHVSNEPLRQCVDDLKHSVNTHGVSFTHDVYVSNTQLNYSILLLSVFKLTILFKHFIAYS